MVLQLTKRFLFFNGEFQNCLIGKADLKKVVKKYLKNWGWQKSVNDLLKEWFQAGHNIDKELADYINSLRKKGIRVYLNNQPRKIQNTIYVGQNGLYQNT